MKKLNLIFSFVLNLIFIEKIVAIKCYSCQVSPSYTFNVSKPVCAKFDKSDAFVVECPYSTMCVKKIMKLQLIGETTEAVSRGCASQKYTDQVLVGRQWTTEYRVEEPYEEECKELSENNLAATTITYCHCRGNYCNSAKKDTPSYHTEVMAVLFVFNALKIFRMGTIRS